MSFTVSQINFPFNQQSNQSQSSKPGYAKPNINLAKTEIQTIFFKKGAGPQKWYVDELPMRKEANCCTCPSTIPAEKLYIPSGQHFAKERTFYFCALMKCFGKTPYMNNVYVLTITVEL